MGLKRGTLAGRGGGVVGALGEKRREEKLLSLQVTMAMAGRSTRRGRDSC